MPWKRQSRKHVKTKLVNQIPKLNPRSNNYKVFKFFPICNNRWQRSGPENYKKSWLKKLVKSNNSISRKMFLTKFHFFCNFKNGQKSIFEVGNSIKMQFHKVKKILFDFTSFFVWTFLKFLGRYAPEN